jgi:putative ABC transport system permease protein
MIAPKYVPLVVKQITRHRMRSVLTIAGVATAMFLFVAVQAMQRGVATATEETAAETTLVVYRKDRYCPFTSQLPDFYGRKISDIEGVREVVPMKIVVNVCRASLDTVTLRGVPVDKFVEQRGDLELIAGSIENWKRTYNGALVGETLAMRRGFKVGDTFKTSQVQNEVSGIFRSDEPQNQNVAYVHLKALQQATDKDFGIVTQFQVKVDDPSQMDAVAAAIDDEFAVEQEPTTTRSEKAFVAHAASDLIELMKFTRYLGWGCLFAVLALVGNAIVLSVQDRVKEHAILQTLGFKGSLIGRLIVAEGILVGLLGGGVGTAGAVGVLYWKQLSLSVDGLSIPISADTMLLLAGLAISLAIGVIAGLVPAWQASRHEIASCFRAV